MTNPNPIQEVRRNRELLLENHGGIDGLHRYMENERSKLEQQGWKFTPLEEILAKKQQIKDPIA